MSLFAHETYQVLFGREHQKANATVEIESFLEEKGAKGKRSDPHCHPCFVAISREASCEDHHHPERDKIEGQENDTKVTHRPAKHQEGSE